MSEGDQAINFKNNLQVALNFVKDVIDENLREENHSSDQRCEKEILKIYSNKFSDNLDLWNILLEKGIGKSESTIRKSVLLSLQLQFFPHKIPKASTLARDQSKLVYSKFITYDEITNALGLNDNTSELSSTETSSIGHRTKRSSEMRANNTGSAPSNDSISNTDGNDNPSELSSTATSSIGHRTKEVQK